MSVEQKITNNIKVPNHDLETLRKHFPHCFDKDGNFQLEKFTQNLTEKEINFSSESYGMDWLGKSYARLLASDPASTLLKANETHNQQPENVNSENLLIKGDNLEVLKHLANAYYEKIKMIYIDPPYNTGSDGFVYEDDRKFTVKQLRKLIGVDEERAKRILDFTKTKSNSHSAWLTFMYPRLYIAKQLLKDDGVIFISIDDNEVAQLRLLMDEIFGEENFVASIIWERAYSPVNLKKQFSESHDYLLVYAKNVSELVNKGLKRSDEANARYSNPDNDYRGDWTSSDLSVGPPIQENIYDITTPSGRVVPPPSGYSWRLNKIRFQEFLNDNRIWFGTEEGNVPRIKRFLSEVKEGVTPMTIWKYSDVGHSQEAAQSLKKLFDGAAYFDYPKPIGLIKRSLELYTNPTDLILDFFAGSGTTGDAVMQLNAEDGGNRKFILVQIPEEIDPKKSKVAYDFVKDELKAEPTIFEITKERLIRAAKKTQENIKMKIEAKNTEIKAFEGKLDLGEKDSSIKQLNADIENLHNQDLGFKVFETMPIWEDYDLDIAEFDEQIKLFSESKMTEDDLKTLLTTWKTFDGIPLTQEMVTIDLGGYKAYYGSKKLYLMHRGFTTDHLVKLLEKIDSDKKFEPRSIITFGYYFDSKNLRELSESMKSYTNKKHIDIDFITRY